MNITIPCVLTYFIAGIAGSGISVENITFSHDFKKRKKKEKVSPPN